MTELISNGKKISLVYQLYCDGILMDQNPIGQKFEYVHGNKEILPALEEALLGLKVGDEKTVILEPHQAFGEIRTDGFQTVPLSLIPADYQKVGAIFGIQDGPDHRQVRIHQILADQAVLDFHHALAGKTLTFKIRVESIS